MLTASQHDRISSLQSYLDRIAHNLVRTHYQEQDPDDLLQQMNLYILERVAKEPEFLDKPDGYITKSAAWAARNFCRSDLRGVNHGWHRAAFSLDAENDDGIDNGEVFAEESPDTDLAISIREALSALSEKTQLVAKLMLAGYRGIELAKQAGLNSKPAVSYHRRLIKQALTPVYAVS